MFCLYGPNTNHGSGSVPYTLECQFSYVLDAIGRLRSAGSRYLDLRPAVQDAWRREIAERSIGTVWKDGGCGSWYLNAAGREHEQLAGAVARVQAADEAPRPARVRVRRLARLRAAIHAERLRSR